MADRSTQERKHSSSVGVVAEGALSLLDQSLCSGANFVTAVLIGRATTKEEFGLYSLAFALSVVLTGVQSSLFATPYTVLHPSLPPYRQAYYADVVQLHQLLFALVTFVVLTGVAMALDAMGPVGDGARSLLGILPIAIVAMLTRDHLRRMYLGNLRMQAAVTLDFAVLVLQLSGVTFLLASDELNATTAYVVVTFACILPSSMIIGLRARSLLVVIPGFREFFADNWRIGRWKLGTHVSISAGTKAFPWLLAIFHGPAATAVYSACISLFVVANPFMMGMRNFLVPKLSRLAAVSSVDVTSMVRSSTRIIGSVMGMGLILVCMYGGTAIEWIYTEKYAGNGGVVCVLALATMTLSLIHI